MPQVLINVRIPPAFVERAKTQKDDLSRRIVKEAKSETRSDWGPQLLLNETETEELRKRAKAVRANPNLGTRFNSAATQLMQRIDKAMRERVVPPAPRKRTPVRGQSMQALPPPVPDITSEIFGADDVVVRAGDPGIGSDEPALHPHEQALGTAHTGDLMVVNNRALDLPPVYKTRVTERMATETFLEIERRATASISKIETLKTMAQQNAPMFVVAFDEIVSTLKPLTNLEKLFID